MTFNKQLNRDLPSRTIFEFRDTFKIDGSTTNQTAFRMAKAAGTTIYNWHGPTIAYGCTESPTGELLSFWDLDTMKFKSIIDWLRFFEGGRGMYFYTDPETGMNVMDSGDGAKKRYLKATGKKEEDLGKVNLLEIFKAFEETAKLSKHGNARPAT